MVGIWVYGLDHPDYKVERDFDPTKISISNQQSKEDMKAQLCISPFLWASLIKFYLDVNIYQRVSVSSKWNSFIVVHFFHVSANPQFLEFKMVQKINLGIQQVNPHRVSNSDEQSSWSQYVLSLNDQDYLDNSFIKGKSL